MTASHRRHALLSLTAALTALGFIVAGLVAAPAGAFDNNYCGVLIYELHWCGDGSDHTYSYNQASYNGGGSVYVCERLLWSSSLTERLPMSCSYSLVQRNYGATSSLSEAEVTHANSGGAQHTIYGYAHT
jgi:hypothetical protein